MEVESGPPMSLLLIAESPEDTNLLLAVIRVERIKEAQRVATDPDDADASV